MQKYSMWKPETGNKTLPTELSPLKGQQKEIEYNIENCPILTRYMIFKHKIKRSQCAKYLYTWELKETKKQIKQQKKQ